MQCARAPVYLGPNTSSMCYWEVQIAYLIESLARCTVQFALIAVTNVKFHSNLNLADQSIVEIVGQKEDGQEDSVTSYKRLDVYANL